MENKKLYEKIIKFKTKKKEYIYIYLKQKIFLIKWKTKKIYKVMKEG